MEMKVEHILTLDKSGPRYEIIGYDDAGYRALYAVAPTLAAAQEDFEGQVSQYWVENRGIF